MFWEKKNSHQLPLVATDAPVYLCIPDAIYDAKVSHLFDHGGLISWDETLHCLDIDTTCTLRMSATQGGEQEMKTLRIRNPWVLAVFISYDNIGSGLDSRRMTIPTSFVHTQSKLIQNTILS